MVSCVCSAAAACCCCCCCWLTDAREQDHRHVLSSGWHNDMSAFVHLLATAPLLMDRALSHCVGAPWAQRMRCSHYIYVCTSVCVCGAIHTAQLHIKKIRAKIPALMTVTDTQLFIGNEGSSQQQCLKASGLLVTAEHPRPSQTFAVALPPHS